MVSEFRAWTGATEGLLRRQVIATNLLLHTQGQLLTPPRGMFVNNQAVTNKSSKARYRQDLRDTTPYMQ